MDEEGYPLMNESDNEGFPLVVRLIPVANPPEILDHPPVDDVIPECEEYFDRESGETTNTRVVIMRKSPLPKHTMCNIGRRRRWQRDEFDDRVTCQMLLSHHIFNSFSCHAVNQLQEKGTRGRIICNQSMDNLHHAESSFHSQIPQNCYAIQKVKNKKRFFVPPGEQETKSKRTKEIQVSIWKEFFLGESVIDNGELEWKEIAQKYKYPYCVKQILGNLRLYLPFYIVKLLQLIILSLRLVMPHVSFLWCYYQRLYTHMKIHKYGDERGVSMVFTGKVYHGPIIYGVRVLRCPYCRHRSESKVLLKYFERLCEERRQEVAMLEAAVR